MAFKTFVNGFPLNASELNTYLMSQTIATFANTTARDEAIDSPAEGQVVYIENTASFLWWTGADWEDFGGVPSLTANRAVATNGSGALVASDVTATELGYLDGVTSSIQTQLDGKTSGALVKIAAQSFTTASSVNVNSVFSSTYRNYVVQTSFVGSTSNDVFLRFRASGTDNTSSSYNEGGFWSNNVRLDRANVNYLTLGSYQNNAAQTVSASALTIYNPFESATTTNYSLLHVGSKSGFYNIGGLSSQAGLQATGAFDGFTFYTSTGTITGNVTIYGLVN